MIACRPFKQGISPGFSWQNPKIIVHTKRELEDTVDQLMVDIADTLGASFIGYKFKICEKRGNKHSNTRIFSNWKRRESFKVVSPSGVTTLFPPAPNQSTIRVYRGWTTTFVAKMCRHCLPVRIYRTDFKASYESQKCYDTECQLLLIIATTSGTATYLHRFSATLWGGKKSKKQATVCGTTEVTTTHYP